MWLTVRACLGARSQVTARPPAQSGRAAFRDDAGLMHRGMGAAQVTARPAQGAAIRDLGRGGALVHREIGVAFGLAPSPRRGIDEVDG